MNRTIIAKSLRDYALVLVLITIGLIGFEVVVIRMLVEASHDLELLRAWLERPLIKTLLQLALGAEFTAADLNPTNLAAFGLAHPFVYAMAWTLLLAITTGVVAGEVGRGTADLLLTLPLRRSTVYISSCVPWLIGIALISAACVFGLALGERIWPLDKPLDLGRIALVSINLAALNFCIAGVTMMVSSLTSRRTIAIGVVLTALLISDVVNLVVPFWEAIEPIAFLGFLHYYRPLPLLRSGALPAGDLTILIGVGTLCWLIGLWHFSRRDIPAA